MNDESKTTAASSLSIATTCERLAAGAARRHGRRWSAAAWALASLAAIEISLGPSRARAADAPQTPAADAPKKTFSEAKKEAKAEDRKAALARKRANKPDKEEKKLMDAMTPAVDDGLFVLLDVSTDPDENFGKNRVQVGMVPFSPPSDAKEFLDLSEAQWPDWEKDFPWSHESPKPRQAHDPKFPLLKAPTADYVAWHVLAVADDNPATAPAFTFRMGEVPNTGNEQCVQFDFLTHVPRRGEAAKADPKTIVKAAGESLRYVRVPTTFAFAQDIDPSKPLEIEVTKEVRLARRNPDPARYRYRALGLPSGVRIAAITLEKSPLQMRVTSDVAAHAFVEPQKPTFKVSLTNITQTAQPYTLTFQAIHLGGTKVEAHSAGRVEPGQTADVSVPIPVGKRGYYDLGVTLTGADQRVLLRRETSFALLPPDTRQYRAESPFGTYYFGGSHYTCRDTDKTGPLYVKLGMRYGMFGSKEAEARRKYGLVKGNEPIFGAKSAKKGPDPFGAVLAENPDLPPMAMIFHETSISSRHITRVPDLFTDRTLTMNAEEEAHFTELWDSAVEGAKVMREKYPHVKVALGNGPLPTKEEFFRRHFPAELFETAGNESGSFAHPPEAQPPDWMSNNASLWMDRQMLDAYGYKDKPVSQCHEVCYPSTNPGNLDFTTQADYFVRHAMHSLGWRVEAFRPGILADVGGNYRWSEWGSSGFCHAFPEMNVKPSFVAFATMTLMLDGARFVRDVPLGSDALYVAEFVKRDNSQVFALWTLRGQRPLALTVEGGDSWKLVDDQANETMLTAKGGKLDVTLTPSPIYLVGAGRLKGATAGPPSYDDKPDGKVSPLAPLDTLKDWVVEDGHNVELEYYDFMTPRRKGDFAFEPVAAFEGQSSALRVTPKPIATGKDTMPMYASLAHKTGLPIPGTPTEIGLWINGNAGWGRVIYDLTDASGQRWISIGAQMPLSPNLDPATYLPQDVLARFPSPGISDWSTEDAWGLSRINFDGWRYTAFPLPGNYPGEGYGWAANSQWRSVGGDGKVHYPLTLKKLVVELNEKTLHMQTFAAIERPEIYLKDLVVAQGDTVRVKTIVPETASVHALGPVQKSAASAPRH